MWSLILLFACSAPLEVRPALPDAGATSTVRVATWNIEWLHATDGAGMRPRTAAEYDELAATIRDVKADVWAFQEVAGRAAVERILGAGWQVHVEDRQADQRVAVAVRDGLSATFGEVEPVAVGRSGLRRGVTAHVPGLEVMAVHLKAGCQWDPLDSGAACETLQQQLAEVETWLDARTGPAVVVGDYNRQLTGHDDGWKGLNDGAPRPLVAPLLDAPDRCPGSRHRHPIDQVVVAGVGHDDVRAGQIRARASSDHCPVWVELDIVLQ